mgnify:CR=1 FL=1
MKQSVARNLPHGESSGAGAVVRTVDSAQLPMKLADGIAAFVADSPGMRTVLVVGAYATEVVEALRAQSIPVSGYAGDGGISAAGLASSDPCHAWCGTIETTMRYDLMVALDLAGVADPARCQRFLACATRCADQVLAWLPARPRTSPAGAHMHSALYWVQEFSARGYSAAFVDGREAGGPYFVTFTRQPSSASLLDDIFAKVDQLADRCAQQQVDFEKALKTIEGKDRNIADLTYQFLAVQQTIGWKILERVWRLTTVLAPPGSTRRTLYSVLRRSIEIVSRDGAGVFVRKVAYCLRQSLREGRLQIRLRPVDQLQDRDAQYQVWLRQHAISPRALEERKLEGTRFHYQPHISIVTPVYNTDPVWLKKAIESVIAQIYPHWELCLANDASTKAHVKELLDDYAAKEPRIRVTQLSSNRGIAGASAEALSLATGEFVGLLDHDDELSPDALFEVVKVLQERRDLDFLFSDEDKIASNGQLVEPFFKPGWNPQLILSMNYIAHFSVFRRSVLAEAGGFRTGFDGSQDYDLVLRVTERTSRIAHIPKVLYHWRKIPGSTASFNHAKPYADDKAKRALEEAMVRREQRANVDTLWLGRYRVRYALTAEPLVSIIIPFKDKVPLLQQCLESIRERSRYRNYEVLLLDNNSMEPETHRYLEAVPERCRLYRYPHAFNYSAINNFGVGHAKGRYLLFLNNDTQVIEPHWIDAMLEHAQQYDVGEIGRAHV